jgi:septal ring factor EnvC (AmiA/AmiB activator)
MSRSKDTKREMVLVPLQDLKQLRDDVQELSEALDVVTRRRLDLQMHLKRLTSVIDMYRQNEEKTPVRPPSQEDVHKAFRSSGSFSGVKDPRREPDDD